MTLRYYGTMILWYYGTILYYIILQYITSGVSQNRVSDFTLNFGF